MTTSLEKAFAITAAFEGGGYSTLSGSFDGMGISFGFLQYNLGTGTLQPLLRDMAAADRAEFSRCCTQPVADAPFNGKPVDLSNQILEVCAMPAHAAVRWAIARQDGGHRLLPHWTACFKALAAVPKFQGIQRKHAQRYVDDAIGIMRHYGFKSERALALCFDITVQMGSVTSPSDSRYIASTGANQTEQQRLEMLARAIAPQAGRWANDVLARKLTIARGLGVVHGRPYNLARDFGLSDGPVS
jgi:hypothetical protein